jgi:hypothetical protein
MIEGLEKKHAWNASGGGPVCTGHHMGIWARNWGQTASFTVVRTLPGNRVGKGRGGRIERGKGEAFGICFSIERGGKGEAFGIRFYLGARLLVVLLLGQFLGLFQRTVHTHPCGISIPVTFKWVMHDIHPMLEIPSDFVRFRQISSRRTTTFATQQQQSDYIRDYFGF